MGIGIFFSGVFIRVKKPSPKFVAAWIALTALLYAIGKASKDNDLFQHISTNSIYICHRYGSAHALGLSHDRFGRSSIH